jgi:hypothetical protein
VNGPQLAFATDVTHAALPCGLAAEGGGLELEVAGRGLPVALALVAGW